LNDYDPDEYESDDERKEEESNDFQESHTDILISCKVEFEAPVAAFKLALSTFLSWYSTTKDCASIDCHWFYGYNFTMPIFSISCLTIMITFLLKFAKNSIGIHSYIKILLIVGLVSYVLILVNFFVNLFILDLLTIRDFWVIYLMVFPFSAVITNIVMTLIFFMINLIVFKPLKWILGFKDS